MTASLDELLGGRMGKSLTVFLPGGENGIDVSGTLKDFDYRGLILKSKWLGRTIYIVSDKILGVSYK